MISNYLENVLYLLSKKNIIYFNEFISDFSNCVDIIQKIYYPDIDTKREIINHLKKIEEVLQKYKIDISKENMPRYERHLEE